METYDPNSSDIASLISAPPAEEKKSVPTGLVRAVSPPPEKNLDESQMAEFSSAIDDVMPGPGQMIQDKVQGSAFDQMPPTKKEAKEPKGTKNPLGLTDDQYFAGLAGVAAVIAFSKPVQTKLSSMIPKFMEEGNLSLTGMAVTALIAAIIFYFARKFLTDRD
jgi:hypothetical protein